MRADHKSLATRMIIRVEEILAAEEVKVLDSEILSLVNDDELEEDIAQADLSKKRTSSNLISIEKVT